MTSPNKYFLKAQIHSLEAFMGDIKQKSTFLFFWFINIFLIGVGKRKTDTDWASINFMHNCKIHQLLEEVFPCLLLLFYYCEYTWCLWCFIVVINLLSGWHQVTFIYPITHWILCGCHVQPRVVSPHEMAFSCFICCCFFFLGYVLMGVCTHFLLVNNLLSSTAI